MKRLSILLLISALFINATTVNPGDTVVTVGGARDWYQRWALEEPVLGVDFDGEDDDMEITDDNSLDMTSGVTVACWIRVDDYGSQAADSRHFGHIVSKWESYVLRVHNQPVVNEYGWDFTVWVGSTDYTITSSSTADIPTLDVWTHIAGTYDGETNKIYENGVLLRSNTSPSGNLDTNAKHVYLGNFEAKFDGTDLDGEITEIGIWNVALTDSEIAKLSERNTQGKIIRGLPLLQQRNNLVTYLPLNDFAASTALDGQTMVDVVGSNDAVGDDGPNNSGLTSVSVSI